MLIYLHISRVSQRNRYIKINALVNFIKNITVLIIIYMILTHYTLTIFFIKFMNYSDTVLKSKFFNAFFLKNHLFFIFVEQKESFSQFVEPKFIYWRRIFSPLFFQKSAKRKLSLHHYPKFNFLFPYC